MLSPKGLGEILAVSSKMSLARGCSQQLMTVMFCRLPRSSTVPDDFESSRHLNCSLRNVENDRSVRCLFETLLSV